MFNTNRPCNSKTRAHDRYTRSELEKIAKQYNVQNISKKTMDEICKELHTLVGKPVKAKSPTPVKTKSPTPKLSPVKVKLLKNNCNLPENVWIPGNMKLKTKGQCVKVKQILKTKQSECKYPNIWVKGVCVVPEIKGKSPVKKQVKSTTISPKKQVKTTPTKLSPKKQVKSTKKTFTKEEMYDKFKEYFKEDLIGYIGKDVSDFRVFVSGGYGVKMTLEEKHGIYGKINTKDIDLTIGFNKSKMTGYSCFEYWYNKVKKFVEISGDKKNFKIQVLNLYGDKVPIFNYRRYYVIMLDYKDDEFIDMAITDKSITENMIDVPLSKKVGLPIKTEEEYLKEFLTFIYMENVPGVNYFVYEKRNPVTGKLPSKGQKDILNSKLLCDKVKKEKYKEYCKLLKDVTVEKLKSMSKIDRDDYFKSFKTIISTH